MLVLVSQRGQVHAAAEPALLAVDTVAVVATSGALLVAALAPRQPFMVAAFEQRRLSAGHTLPAEVLADQLSHLDPIMVVLACLLCGRRDSLPQSVSPQGHMLAESLRQIVNQIALAQSPPRQMVNQLALAQSPLPHVVNQIALAQT